MQGLQNIGATCAINSLIQIICRTKQLREVLLENLDVIPENSLAYELKDILNLMHNNNNSLSPNRFVKKLFKNLNSIFTFGEQIDISELWIFLFNKLSSEVGKNIIVPSIDNVIVNINDISNNSLSNCNELKLLCDYKVAIINERKISNWCDTSTGILLNILKCNKCNNYIYNFEPFISIYLDIPDDKKIHSLASMFRNFLNSQVCKDSWMCEKCNEKTEYTKYVKLWKLPPVLIFVINRFSNINMKNTSPISINNELCIKKGSVVSSINTEFKYYPTSFGMHYGNLSGGHYCAVCKVDDRYILYDDLDIRNINKENIKKMFECNKDAYMIIYTL